MNTLTQTPAILNTQLSLNVETFISFLKAPFTYQFSTLDYGKLFECMDQWMRKFMLACLAKSIYEADLQFRNAPGRTQRYYVKQTRERTIITILGELTYLRTEYIDRDTNKPFIPIDRKLCLASRQRFDCCVEAKVKELYADHNSMIKVGKITGEMIHGHFSLDSNNYLKAIPRQTVFNLLHRVKKIVSMPQVRNETPDTLYIMADEKYVPIQGECTEEKSHVKEMVKVAVCFEGREREVTKSGELTNRFHLINKFTHATCASEKETFWPDFMGKLAHRYDLSKVKKIYVLGDGASWIKSAVPELTTYGTSVKYALDKFHASQAIHRMTKDETYRDLLTYYLYANQRDDFDFMAEFSKKELKTEAAIKTHSQYYDYLIKNWDAFQVMVREVKIGCAMEQSISHIIASPFTSVPKAYSRSNLPYYLDTRIHLQNNENLIEMYLKALQLQTVQGETIELKDKIDWSFFDDQIPNDFYTVHLNNRQNAKTQYKF